jgi:hypothetical protein
MLLNNVSYTAHGPVASEAAARHPLLTKSNFILHYAIKEPQVLLINY